MHAVIAKMSQQYNCSVDLHYIILLDNKLAKVYITICICMVLLLFITTVAIYNPLVSYSYTVAIII